MDERRTDVGDALRELGLRSTPQRRAILLAFRGGVSEHLSADEVHARAAQELPDLGRGTVYATLAEFTEAGLIAALGTPEPVRYESNTEPHDHFRCRVCLRLFDVGTLEAAQPPMPRGFRLERVETRAEGVCADCASYERGLRRGAARIAAEGVLPEPLPVGVAALEAPGPLGPMLLAASPAGVVRVAFPDHGDADGLRAAARRGRGNRAAKAIVEQAARELQRYLAGRARELRCPVDWASLATPDRDSLAATMTIPYGDRRSYAALGSGRPAYELGATMGANPIAIAAPCHRVTRGVEVPAAFVGGTERRRWLEAHERRHAT